MNNLQPRLSVTAPAELSFIAVSQLAQGWFLLGEIAQHSEKTLSNRRDIVHKLLWFLRTKKYTVCDVAVLVHSLSISPISKRDVKMSLVSVAYVTAFTDAIWAEDQETLFSMIRERDHERKGSLDNQWGHDALAQAVSYERFALAQALLDAGVDVNGSMGSSLIGLVRENNANRVKFLLDHGADANTTPDCSLSRQSVLMMAVETGIEVATLLLDYGANINAQNFQGQTALMLAARAKDAEMVALLLSRGADATIKTPHGMTARKYARQNLAIVDLLVKAGAKTWISPELQS